MSKLAVEDNVSAATQGQALSALASAALDYERRLEQWICEDASVLGLELVVVGNQVNTGFGRIDVLAMTREGELVVVEIKRDRTPRDVVAQTLEYASWVNEREYEDFERIALELRGKPLKDLFNEAFDSPLPAEISGGNHRVLLAMSPGIIGCPHEEGTDYPDGEACPQCPYWASRDRWTGDELPEQ